MNPIMWLDDIGKPAWIGLTIVSFVVWWPAGILVLGYLIGSGRMSCAHHHGDRWQGRMDRMHERAGQRMDRMYARASRWYGSRSSDSSGSAPSGSGNRAFDEYRTETLRRLEEEERQFKEFLDRLRHAKDKAEFDEFMADMRRRPPENPAPQPEY